MDKDKFEDEIGDELEDEFLYGPIDEDEILDEPINSTLLKGLVDTRDRTLQKSRIAFGNRLKAIEKGKDTVEPETLKLLEKWYAIFLQYEKEAEHDIQRIVKGNEIVERMIKVKGVGRILAAKVICTIDIHRADTVSALWRYAGFAVIDGGREREIRGVKRHYNKRLKIACLLVGGSFLKSNSPYRRIYDDSRIYYEANRPEWTKLRQHDAAMRRMVKVWLSHLWEVWRKMEGLPVRPPYVQERMGHVHYMEPEEFGW